MKVGEMWRALRCALGLHFWHKRKSDFPQARLEPSIYDDEPTPRRICLRCGGFQDWLPGYGSHAGGNWCSTEFPRQPVFQPRFVLIEDAQQIAEAQLRPAEEVRP